MKTALLIAKFVATVFAIGMTALGQLDWAAVFLGWAILNHLAAEQAA